jgi:ParB family transcriptional regulator, chromosome partitioning protein
MPRMVNKKPKGLGLGLQALLGPTVASPSPDDRPEGVRELRLDQIAPGRYQPRTRMDEGALMELADSIRAQGLMQPILVRPLGDTPAVGAAIAPSAPGVAKTPARYEIIAGERRARAAHLAGLVHVPVLVKTVPDEAAAAMSLIENIQREDLNPLEEAQGLQRLVQEFGLTHEQAAQSVGRSRSAASNLLRLLQLAEPVQQWLMAGDLDMGHARALLPLPRADQVQQAQAVVARQLSVRETERLVQQVLAAASRSQAQPASAPERGSRSAAAPSRDVLRLQEQLADVLTAPVEILSRGRQGAGELRIRYGSFDELQGLLQRMGLKLGDDDA